MRRDKAADQTEFDTVDEALRQSASTFRSPRMFDADDTDAIVGSVRWKPVKSLWISAMTLAALIGGPLFFTWGALALFLVTTAVQLLRAAGATRVHRISWAPFLFHIHSTLRMGLQAADSVLDANAESRWVRGLFVADNAALANSLGGPNPTLTTQALATRTAEKIFRRYFDGDPWVGREDPISSIDPKVTKAVIRRGL